MWVSTHALHMSQYIDNKGSTNVNNATKVTATVMPEAVLPSIDSDVPGSFGFFIKTYVIANRLPDWVEAVGGRFDARSRHL